jgi:hypothetical protein
MGGARHKDFTGGARARLFVAFDANPEQLWRGVWHPHIFGEGSLDFSGGNLTEQLSLGSGESGHFRRAGHHVPVRFTYLRDGVPEEAVMSATATTLTIAAGAGSVTEIEAAGL